MYYVGVDIGGTFTDCVLVDRRANHRTAKVLSTKDDPVAGGHEGRAQLPTRRDQAEAVAGSPVLRHGRRADRRQAGAWGEEHQRGRGRERLLVISSGSRPWTSRLPRRRTS